jgi:hypothetical protein
MAQHRTPDPCQQRRHSRPSQVTGTLYNAWPHSWQAQHLFTARKRVLETSLRCSRVLRRSTKLSFLIQPAALPLHMSLSTNDSQCKSSYTEHSSEEEAKDGAVAEFSDQANSAHSTHILSASLPIKNRQILAALEQGDSKPAPPPCALPSLRTRWLDQLRSRIREWQHHNSYPPGLRPNENSTNACCLLQSAPKFALSQHQHQLKPSQ